MTIFYFGDMGEGLSVSAERISKGTQEKCCCLGLCTVQGCFPRKLGRKSSRVNLKYMFHRWLKEGLFTRLLGYVLRANREQSKKSCTKERRRWSRRRKRVGRKQLA